LTAKSSLNSERALKKEERALFERELSLFFARELSREERENEEES